MVASTSVGDAAASTISSPLARSTLEGTEAMVTEEPGAVPTSIAPPVQPGALLTMPVVAARTKGIEKGAKSGDPIRKVFLLNMKKAFPYCLAAKITGPFIQSSEEC